MTEKVFLQEVVLDLTGPTGNAYDLLGQAKNFARGMGMSDSEVEEILNEMKSGDYENLIQVFNNNFGHFCTLER
tara:strand:+ start:140 stop:361 length:222 start_codon:yes stop_codon:yes gene_type:complete